MSHSPAVASPRGGHKSSDTHTCLEVHRCDLVSRFACTHPARRHTIAFTLLRDSFEQGSGVGSLTAWAKATAITAVPTAVFVAMRKPVPAPVLFGLYSTVLLHGYDRVLKSLTPFSEHMASNRRAF